MPATEFPITSHGVSAGRSAAEIDRLAAKLEAIGDPDALAILGGLTRRLERFDRERDMAQRRFAWLRDRVLDRLAARLRRAGATRIALYGAGFHTAPIVRHPWRHHGIEVVALLDDAPRARVVGGVPVVTPEALAETIDAIVISSDSHEPVLYRRAVERFGGRLPVHRIYGAEEPAGDEADLVRLLLARGFGPAEAEWLVSPAAGGLDANLPIGSGRALESALRRYEFAAGFARGRRAIDLGCRGGFGAAILRAGGARRVLGVDRDERAVDYARRRYGSPAIEFEVGDPARPPADDGAADLVVAFDAIDLARDARELERLLVADGLAIVARSLEPPGAGCEPEPDPGAALLPRTRATSKLVVVEQWGQMHADEPRTPGRPPGFFRVDPDAARPDAWFIMLRRSR